MRPAEECQNRRMELAKTNTPPPPCPQIRLGKIESDLVQKPKYGIFPWWPDDAINWVHPDDLSVAKELVPGNKILRRATVMVSGEDESLEGSHDRFSSFEYGSQTFRASPRMWLEVPEPDYELSDQVEIRSKLGKIHPKIATVTEVCWNRSKRIAEYRLAQIGMPVAGLFHAADLQPAVRLGETLPLRHLNRRASIRFVD